MDKPADLGRLGTLEPTGRTSIGPGIKEGEPCPCQGALRAVSSVVFVPSTKLEPELASTPDRGLDAQPVPAPDRRLHRLAVRGWSVEKETPVLHALEAATSARAAAN